MVTATKTTVIEVEPIKTQTATVAIRGISPMIMNRMSEKVRQELLLPRGRMTAADKAANLKHNPMQEFRASAHVISDDDSPTLLGVPSSSIKNAMMTAALRLPGVKKTEIAQMVWVEGTLTEVYGIPEVFCSVTKMADINRTPDVKTRCIVPEWAAIVTITFMVPMLTERSILNLLAGAGQVSGLGDWRRQKGGSYGAFIVTDPVKDEGFKTLMANGGRAAQIAAIEEPAAFDNETEALLAWFDDELESRGRSLKAA